MQIRMDTTISFWAIVLLLTVFIENSSSVAKKLNASQAFDDTWSTATDLENELEQKRAGKGSGSSSSSASSSSASYTALTGGGSQWSGWSEWSTCSRTCDGGIMQQMRRCFNQNGGCKGDSTRFRICNMQPCPEQQDFRADQCAAYNDVPYDGTLYRWTPHYDYVEPCALTCRGRPAHLSDDVSPEADGSDDSEHYEEPSVIVQLSARVQDGTRCRSGSLDMCIQGKCQRVGCDLKIGSTKKVDGCGVCGGDGSSCTQPLYQWEMAAMSQCSVTCGGGYKMSRPVCKNRLSGGEVDDSLCNAATRPEQAVLLCNSHTCPPRWIADEWSLCSRLCGHGYRERMVVCAEENDGVKTRVSDIMCRTPKPSTQETCLIEDCPKWEVDEWTGCSVSCGQGIQMRGVECKSGDGSLSAKCDPLTKPSSAQQCSTGIPCDGSSVGGGGAKQKGNRMSGGGKIIIGSSGPLMSRDRIEDTSDMDEEEEEDDEEAEEDVEATDDGEDMDKYSADGEPESLSYNDQPLMYAHHQSNRLHQEELPEPRTQFLTFRSTAQPSAEPTFIKDNDWSPCSVTCGEGIRRRPYKCKIFLEYSRTVATVNDTLCEGPKPHDEVERCVEEPCMLPSHGYDEQYPRDSIKVGVSEPGKTYVWREQGYTSCSASCLGGVEELIINCVREDNGRVVSPFLCAPETKPEARVRTCNDRPCPPRWNYSDYTPCSKSCGIGIKTREVQCIHEVTRGGENTMVVPNSMCPQPPPADRQYCNVLDCPVRWEVGEWSKCSHTCGYGIKERKVECKQIMAQEHKIERPETMCPSAKPPDKKPCNVKPCPPEDPKPIISISNTTHIQHDPKKSKITLKVGGAGVVFFGTQVKIKCPVKRYNRTKIKWSKDHKPLARSRKFKVSKKGALRILDITFRDAGIYSCHAGLSSAEIQIEVKAKPGQQAEDLERQDLDRLVRERSGSEPLTSADMTAADALNSTQSTRRKQQSGRERNRRPKTDVVQHRSDGSVIEDEHSQLVQQQAQDGLPQPASANSGGSRTRALLAIPYFQALLANLQYLWPFQKYNGNSRSHKNALLHDKGLQYGIDFDQYEQHPRDEPLKVILSPKSLDNAGYEETAEQPNAHGAEPSNALTSSTTTTTTTTTTTERQHEADENAKEEEDFVEGRIRTGYEESGALSPPHGRWQGRHWAHTNTEVADVGDAEDDGDGDDATTFGYITNFRPNDDDDDSGIANAISTYKWLTSEWSPCTQKCGEQGVGLRRRSVTCVRIRKAYFRNRQAQAAAGDSNGDSDALTMPEVGGGGGEVLPNPVDSADEIVANVYCADYGLSMPATFETCGYGVGGGGGGGNDDEDDYDDPCPRWTEGPWSLCQQSRCFERNTAIQRREVQCRYGNRTVAPGGGCDENVKPISRQECFNERCKGVWRVEPWSECNAPCGRQGIKYRILQCVWYGTRRPAGNACKHQPRPPVMKVCKSAPCLAKLVKGGQCKDSSRYCRNVRTMGLCRLHRYKEKCCKSCKLHLYNK